MDVIFIVILLVGVAHIMAVNRYIKSRRRINELKSESRYKDIPKEYVSVVDFFWTKYQLWITHPEHIMTTIPLKPKRLLFILLAIPLGFLCILLLGGLGLIILVVGLPLSYFYALGKEIAYLDEDRLIHLSFDNFLKTECKRRDILFSEIERAKISTYSYRGNRRVVFTLYLQNSETLKLDMSPRGNATFIDHLTSRLKSLNLLRR